MATWSQRLFHALQDPGLENNTREGLSVSLLTGIVIHLVYILVGSAGEGR